MPDSPECGFPCFFHSPAARRDDLGDPGCLRRRIRVLAFLAGTAILMGCGADVRESPLSRGDHFVDLPGVRLHYRVEGRGPVLLLHPGGPGMEWKYARMPGLEEFLTVVYLDPRGAGASAKPLTPGTYTLSQYAADLEGLRAHLAGGRPIFLLGHSHGGIVAQQYALSHPGRLKGLFLCATTPTTGPEWRRDVEVNLEERRAEPWFPEAAAALAEEATAASDADLAAIFGRELPLYFYRYDPFRDAMSPVLRNLRISAEPVRQFNREAPSLDLRPQLSEIDAPTLILAGRHDFICSPRWAEALHDGIPDSRLVILEKSGHFLYLEEAETFAKAVENFVAELERGR